MMELHKALAEIRSIRGQLARGTTFRGYGPATLACTGVLAMLAAAVQSQWLAAPAHAVNLYLCIWVATAIISLTLISIETITRALRLYATLATEMIHSAAEQFLPAIVAGLLVTVVLVRGTPQSLWMLPGLWQVIFSLGVFSSCRVLPKQMFAVGIWYLVTGLTCLTLGTGAFAPWAMGIPFGIGQMLVAAVLQFGDREADGYADTDTDT
jgi:hypothetical protein